MKDEIKKRLSDIHTAILDIESFLGEKRDFIEYTKNKMLKSAVERKLEIIGEATNYILKVKPDIEIAGARRIVDMLSLIHI